MNNCEKSRRLRELIQAEDTLVMPEDFANILGKNQVCGMEDIAALLKRV